MLAILGALESLWGLIKLITIGGAQLIQWIIEYLNKRDQEKKLSDLKKAVDEAKNAETLDAKANAACKIEKELNPQSDCHVSDGGK